MTPSRTPADTSRLDDVICDLSDLSGTPEALMREHLEEIRFYRIAFMPAECELMIKLATELLPDIEDLQLRSRIRDILREQPFVSA